MNNLNQFLNSIGKAISSALGQPAQPPAAGVAGAAAGTPAQTVSPRVQVIVFDPVLDDGRKLSQAMGWNSVDDLIPAFLADMQEVSYGLVNYRVVGRTDVAEIPVKQDGFRYDVHSIMDVLQGRARPHDPDLADYRRIVDQFNLIPRVMNNEIDEVWMFGGPYFGFYESRMVGRGGFWCNSPALENTDNCPRRFVMMGFNYERTVGEMIHDIGHRTESIMTKVYERLPAEKNVYQRFARYEMVAPGQAEVGVVHFPPNAERDYDWGNPRYVLSHCEDWLNFPNFKGDTKLVNCADWGNGDPRLHHKWWFKRVPHVAGSTDGVAHNWWQYVMQVDRPYFDPR